MRPSLEKVLHEARTLAPEELPELCADLELIRVTALARLASPPVAKPDELLNVEQAAARLNVSTNFLYRNSGRYPFTRREGKGKRLLRFSSNGLDSYLRKSR